MQTLVRRSRPVVFFAVMLFCGAAAVGEQKPPPQTGESRRAGSNADKGAARLKALLVQRLELLRQVEQNHRARLAEGMGGFVDVQRAVIAILQADLDLDHSRAERIALRQRWVDAARTIEDAAEADVKQGTATHESLLQARVARIEAEIGLEREKRALSPRR